MSEKKTKIPNFQPVNESALSEKESSSALHDFKYYSDKLDNLSKTRQETKSEVRNQKAASRAARTAAVQAREKELVPRIRQMLILAEKCRKEDLFDKLAKTRLFQPDSISFYSKLTCGLVNTHFNTISSFRFSQMLLEDQAFYLPITFSVRKRSRKNHDTIYETMIAVNDSDYVMKAVRWTAANRISRIYTNPMDSNLIHTDIHDPYLENKEDLFNAFEKFESDFYKWLDKTL